MIKLSCPSCGGLLELPDNLGVAHCMYCGTKILIEQAEATREQQNLKRFIELCKVALDSKNYDETIQYCNKILEIAPSNVEAWIDKSIATFWLTTGANNRYEEAMGYLKKAAQIAPGDDRIQKAKDELTHQQSWWYNHLGNSRIKTAIEIWNIYDDGTPNSKAQATDNSLEHFNDAMNYFLLAASYAPDDITILENIEYTTKFPGSYITWGEAVHNRLKSLKYLRAKIQAEENLPKYRAELKKAEADLTKFKAEKGFFNSLKIKEAEGRISRLKTLISQNEKAASYKVKTE